VDAAAAIVAKTLGLTLRVQTNSTFAAQDCDVCLWFGSEDSREGVSNANLCKSYGKPQTVIDPERLEPEVVVGWIRDIASKRLSASVRILVAGKGTKIGFADSVEAFLLKMLPLVATG
jgi:hypothetical protein